MGVLPVPADAYYGAQTQRAVQNFSISNLRFPRSFIRAMGQIKMAAAQANVELELLGLGLQLGLQERKGRSQVAGETTQGRDMDRCRDHVIGGLAEVHVVVGVDRCA